MVRKKAWVEMLTQTMRGLQSRAARAPWAQARHLEEPSDEALLDQARRGDARALDRLARRYQDVVYSVVLGMIRHPEDALDLTQDILVKAFGVLDRFAGRSAFRTWLFRIAINRCIDYRRRKSLSVVSLEDETLKSVGFEPVSRSDWGDPARTLDAKELEQEVLRAVDSLPEPLRTAVVLHDIEGMELGQLAEALGCRTGTAKSRLFRGRERIRRRITSLYSSTSANAGS